MAEWIVTCKSCGEQFVVSSPDSRSPSSDLLPPVRCPKCRATAVLIVERSKPRWMLEVEGTDANEVQNVTAALMEKSQMKSPQKNPSPWASGSFYLTVFVVVIASLLVVANTIPIIALPLVLLGGIIALSVIGALQLRQDSQLSQRNFLELMGLTFKYLPWLRPQKEDANKDKQ